MGPSLPSNAHCHISKMTKSILGNEVHKHRIRAVSKVQWNYRLFFVRSHDGEIGKGKKKKKNKRKCLYIRGQRNTRHRSEAKFLMDGICNLRWLSAATLQLWSSGARQINVLIPPLILYKGLAPRLPGCTVQQCRKDSIPYSSVVCWAEP